MATTMSRRRPNMSERRAMIGVATAPESRVAVTSQETAPGVSPRTAGKRGTAGTTSVCWRATTRQLKAATPIRATEEGVAARAGGEDGVMVMPLIRAECAR